MQTIIETHVDIAFAISIVCQFAKNLSSENFNAINHILQYLARSLDKDITFRRDKNFKLIRYSDCDQIRDYADQKSSSGFIFILNKGSISYT